MRCIVPPLAIASLLLAVVGCAETAEPDPEAQRTIRQGVYGQMTVGCDTEDCGDGDAYAIDEDVAAYLEDPHEDPDVDHADGPPPHLATRTDGHGFYELALDPGRYVLCHRWQNAEHLEWGACTEIEVAAGRTLRRDYQIAMDSAWLGGARNF